MNGAAEPKDVDKLLASVGVGQWSWDGRIKRLDLDATCKGFFNMSWDDDISELFLQEKLHPDDLKVFFQATVDCLETGTYSCEFRVKKPDGSFRYLSGRGHVVEEVDGNAIISGVYIDVTQNKELEAQLNTTRSRMQQLADGVPGYFSYIDTDYNVQFMSNQYRQVLRDMGEEKLTGRHIADLIGEDSFAERKEHYDMALAGEEVNFEANRVAPDGRTTYFSVTHKPHFDDAGNVVGVMGLGIDITDRREAELELESKTGELERSNKDLEQFAYVASHDLKAPLRAIDVLIEWLKDDLEGHEVGDVQENLTLLEARTGRLGQLLDDLLAYSRAGRKVGGVRQVNIKSFVEDIGHLIAPPEGFQIVADDSLALEFAAHHAPLETVFRNLLSNAIKHHPEPSKGVIKVYAKDQGDSVMFGVEDNGPGIPEEYADKVFKMFQTLQSRDEVEGSGMGLAIVQRIIDWQGGKIWFHPAAEGGVVFKFTWNKAPQDMPEIETSDKAADDEVAEDVG